MKKTILIIAFIAWGWAWFFGGIFLGINCETLFFKHKKNIVEVVSIAGAGSEGYSRGWEGK